MTYIFYIQLDPTRATGPEYQPIFLPAGKGTAHPQQGVAWVRSEPAVARDEISALNEARPRTGESVMNTYEIQ